MRTKVLYYFLIGGTIFYIIQSKPTQTRDTITFCNSPKPQFSIPAQKNQTQEPSFTFNATRGSEKINQMPSSFTLLISLDIKTVSLLAKIFT